MIRFMMNVMIEFPICFLPLIISIMALWYKKKMKIEASMTHLIGLFVLGGFFILYTFSPNTMWMSIDGLDRNFLSYFCRFIFFHFYFLFPFCLLLVVQGSFLRVCIYSICFFPYFCFFFAYDYCDLYEWIALLESLPPTGRNLNPISLIVLKLFFLIALIATAIMESVRFHKKKKAMWLSRNLPKNNKKNEGQNKKTLAGGIEG